MTIIFYDIPSATPESAWSPNTWKTRLVLHSTQSKLAYSSLVLLYLLSSLQVLPEFQRSPIQDRMG
ncbi:hypothetical protein CPB84DRAFT_1800583 [Gymnopilus junonius]|uniref:Uncharacterized protein n=1 Tax=Gymnopilus junonius TaxID=109634 RepID=A0A9P5N9R9_GYMJU|nr:hypothetical protein CPB84DRAFT_1800583 [Gymnopilus junonius]